MELKITKLFVINHWNDKKSVRKFRNLSHCPRNNQWITTENVRIFKTLQVHHQPRWDDMRKTSSKISPQAKVHTIYSVIWRWNNLQNLQNRLDVSSHQIVLCTKSVNLALWQASDTHRCTLLVHWLYLCTSPQVDNVSPEYTLQIL